MWMYYTDYKIVLWWLMSSAMLKIKFTTSFLHVNFTSIWCQINVSKYVIFSSKIDENRPKIGQISFVFSTSFWHRCQRQYDIILISNFSLGGDLLTGWVIPKLCPFRSICNGLQDKRPLPVFKVKGP